MKIARLVLKIVAWTLMAGAAVCAVIAYWDKLKELTCCCRGKIKAKTVMNSEYDDYEE